MTIKVIFRVDKKEKEVVAFFPELAGDMNPYCTCLCYVHTGQHGAASLDYYQKNTRPATVEEYKNLLDELQEVYDGELRLYQKMTRKDLEKRKEQTKRTES